MIKYFEHAYEGFINTMKDLNEILSVLGELTVIVLIYLTLPVWVLPYWIYKNNKKGR